MIPELFELSYVFNNHNNSKIFYKFLGGICMNSNKIYSTIFYDESYWVYKENNIRMAFNNFNQLIEHCTRYMIYPILIYYQIDNNYEGESFSSDINFFENLENLCMKLDSDIIREQFRPEEYLFKLNDENEEDKMVYCENCRMTNSIESNHCSNCKNMFARNSKMAENNSVKDLKENIPFKLRKKDSGKEESFKETKSHEKCIFNFVMNRC
jgi:hypothetical protein